MKSKTEYLTFNTPTRCAFVNLTPKVRKLVEESGIKEGLCLVNAMHITASVFINDNEGGLHQDYDKWLERLAPHAPT
ncbi:MAG: YjbQ family protein, partial [Nitrososphaeraceae archaeon]